MRALDAAPVCAAAVDPAQRAAHMPGARVILYQADGAGLFLLGPGLPLKGDHVLFAVVIVEHGAVKARRVQIYRLRPGPGDLGRGDHVVVHVKIARVHRVHDAVGQIKQPVLLAPGQARRPNALGRGQPLQMRRSRTLQAVGQKRPVLQIAGMIDGDAGQPLKGGQGDIIVLAPAADAGIRVKARENGIGEIRFHRRLLWLIMGIVPQSARADKPRSGGKIASPD